MNSIFLIGSFLILNFFSISQVSFDNGQTFYTDSSKTTLCHGKYRKYYSGLNLKSSTSFLNGKMHGEYHEFFENGLMKISIHYIDGLYDGEVIEFYPELNEMKSKFHYSKGIKNGEAIYYDEVGEITKKELYVNGVLKE